jgi:hypothetical protein
MRFLAGLRFAAVAGTVGEVINDEEVEEFRRETPAPEKEVVAEEEEEEEEEEEHAVSEEEEEHAVSEDARAESDTAKEDEAGERAASEGVTPLRRRWSGGIVYTKPLERPEGTLGCAD